MFCTIADQHLCKSAFNFFSSRHIFYTFLLIEEYQIIYLNMKYLKKKIKENLSILLEMKQYCVPT